MYSLEAKIRTENARDTRASGAIPAVVYGKDVPSTLVSVATSDFIKVYRTAGKNHVISLTAEKKKYDVLVQEAQRHPVTGAFLHLDFLTVDMKTVVHVQIPVNLTGTSPAVVEGGNLHQPLHAVDVKCLPADIIDGFDLDISTLTMGHTLHVSDLQFDAKKFEILNHPEESIVTVHAPRGTAAEEETETPAPAAAAAPTEEATAE